MMNFKLKIVFLILTSCIVQSVSLAQKKVDIKEADDLFGGRNADGTEFNKLIGNVVMKQNETTIYCDSAYFYKKDNKVEAFGHVKITDGDSVTITSKTLFYDGDTKIARLRDEVVFKKLAQLTLFTDFLDYDRNIQQAKYFNGGKVVDSTNVLTSERGYYQTNTNIASFKKDVVGKNPDYTLNSDTLQYNTKTNIVYFRAPTVLTDVEGNEFEYDEGQYDTNVKRSDLDYGTIETVSYELTGDKLRLDDIAKYYTATGNVEMISKEQDVIITGDFSQYQKNKGIAKVYGNALMKKIMEQDTLYLTADTLVAIENPDPSKERLLAYKNVRIFKKDLQGIADSLSYIAADYIMYFYNDPVLWTGGNQMTADSINVQIANNTIDKLNMSVNSFVVSKDSISNFNQIKGRKMVAHFDAGKIVRVNVDGNGESLFFALDDTETLLVGLNKILCSNMIINFKLNKADNISFYVKPDASFTPPHELKESQKQLDGFLWQEEKKPNKEEMISKNQNTEGTTPVNDKLEISTEKLIEEK
ncbi:MAG: OstA-like protein [Bacteroidota bacterium]